MTNHHFDDETWAQIPDFLAQLPEPIALHVWGDANATAAEQEAARLGQLFADQFPEKVSFRLFPRRVNYPFYPVLGVMGVDGEEFVDYGVRIIGLPLGYQMTSLIAALQVVSFRGQTLEPMTRIKLARLKTAVNIQILTTADNETGALVAKHAFGLAVASPLIRSYLIMADAFPEAIIRYSVNHVPHTIINERVHISGVIDEAELLHQISLAL